MFHNGRWGTICDEGWDWEDAHVVCVMAGFGTAVRPVTDGYYGRGIIIHSINCTVHIINPTSYMYIYLCLCVHIHVRTYMYTYYVFLYVVYECSLQARHILVRGISHSLASLDYCMQIHNRFCTGI